MILKQLIELYDILDSPAASGQAAVEYLRSIDPACDAETYVLEGPKGATDMVRVRIPGSQGRAAGATPPPSDCWAAWAGWARDRSASASCRTATAR